MPFSQLAAVQANTCGRQSGVSGQLQGPYSLAGEDQESVAPARCGSPGTPLPPSAKALSPYSCHSLLLSRCRCENAWGPDYGWGGSSKGTPRETLGNRSGPVDAGNSTAGSEQASQRGAGRGWVSLPLGTGRGRPHGRERQARDRGRGRFRSGAGGSTSERGTLAPGAPSVRRGQCLLPLARAGHGKELGDLRVRSASPAPAGVAQGGPHPAP